MRSHWCALTLIGVLGLAPSPVMADGFWDYLFGKPHLQQEWTYQTGVFDEGASEIAAYDAKSQKVFVTNGDSQAIDVLNAQNGSLLASIPVAGIGGPDSAPTSVAVHNGQVAIAVTANQTMVRGHVLLVDAATLAIEGQIQVGYLPDMVTFSPNGRYILVANEGEPDDDYVLDPEGSVSIIQLKKGQPPAVYEAGFQAFNDQKAALQAAGVRVFGPGASVAQDLEPEYIAVSEDNRWAYVTLQENNALAIVDLKSKEVTSIQPFGLKDHSLVGNALDASNDDDAIHITNWPAMGMYQPDSIAATRILGTTFLFTANEGDARDYDGYSEEERVRDLELDPMAFPNAATLQEKSNLGRLRMTSATGDLDGDGDYDQIHSFGARSFSIWVASSRFGLQQVYDSGDDFERITAQQLPDNFNSTNDENGSFDSRSDDKGPEPEALTLGSDLFQSFCLIGLERVGGIMIYDVSNPFAPTFVEYTNNRDFAGDAAAGTAGDLAPEGIVFIPRGKAPFTEPGVIVANEVSGTTTMYRVKRVGGILSDLFNE